MQKNEGLPNKNQAPISPHHGTQQTPLNGREIEILLVLEPQNNKLFNGCLVKQPIPSRKGLESSNWFSTILKWMFRVRGWYWEQWHPLHHHFTTFKARLESQKWQLSIEFCWSLLGKDMEKMDNVDHGYLMLSLLVRSNLLGHLAQIQGCPDSVSQPMQLPLLRDVFANARTPVSLLSSCDSQPAKHGNLHVG